MKVKLYRDKSRQWRWTVIASNGKKVADSAEGYTRRTDALNIIRKYLKKMPIVFVLCLSLIGLPACSRNYLYQPSVIKRATTAEGLMVISDVHILSFADDVKIAWQKRTQAARGIELAAEGAEAGLGALSVLSTIISIAFPIVGLVSMVSSFISKIVGSIDPDAREGAYLDGIKLIDDAVAEYLAALPKVDDSPKMDKRTRAGEVLLNKVNNAVYKVEAVLSGRVPADTPIASPPAQPKEVLGGIYSITPVPGK